MVKIYFSYFWFVNKNSCIISSSLNISFIVILGLYYLFASIIILRIILWFIVVTVIYLFFIFMWHSQSVCYGTSLRTEALRFLKLGGGWRFFFARFECIISIFSLCQLKLLDEYSFYRNITKQTSKHLLKAKTGTNYFQLKLIDYIWPTSWVISNCSSIFYLILFSYEKISVFSWKIF